MAGIDPSQLINPGVADCPVSRAICVLRRPGREPRQLKAPKMVSVFAELERKRIGERRREALAIRREQGVQLGRPRSVPAIVVRRIQRQRANGESLRSIAESLNHDEVPTGQGGARVARLDRAPRPPQELAVVM